MRFFFLLSGGVLLIAGVCWDCPESNDPTQIVLMCVGLAFIFLAILIQAIRPRLF